MMKYIINTNCDKTHITHDTFKYEPIEVQVFNIIRNYLGKDIVPTKTDSSRAIFRYDNIMLCITIKKSVKLDMYKYSYYDDNLNVSKLCTDFHIGNQLDKDISCNLHYNKDLTKILDKFFLKVDNFSLMLIKLYETKIPNNTEIIKTFLNDKLKTSKLKVSYWNHRFINNFSIAIHPIESAPADGIYLEFDSDNKLVTRKNYDFLRAFNRISYENNLEGLNEKMSDLNELMEKINNFNINECPELILELETSKKRLEIFNQYTNE